MNHLELKELEKGLAEIQNSPKTHGVLRQIVIRPAENERIVLETAELNQEKGLIGDVWADEDGNFETQLAIMNSRTAALFAQSEERWRLAGDQLFVDLDLSNENLPAGTRLSIGKAIVEITSEPHTGCRKFVERFGRDALVLANSQIGRELNLRGIYGKVVKSGEIKIGDQIDKISK